VADWSPRCCICGRFVKYDCDRSTPFGGPTDFEPPDEEYYCAACERDQEEYYVKQGWVPSDWLKARWQRRAAKRLGLVEAGPKGAAWSSWKTPEELPDGWEFCALNATDQGDGDE
jgi:hypothetical protein